MLTGLALLSLLVLLMARGVAHHADQLAERLGEPLGTLVLTGSVIVIELALIFSTMLTGETNPTLARDSMFSVLMIVLTGVKGMTLIVAARMQRQGRTQPMQPEELAIGEFIGTDVILGLDPLESVLLVLTLILVRPISGRVSEIDGLMLLTVGVVWVALQVVS